MVMVVDQKMRSQRSRQAMARLVPIRAKVWLVGVRRRPATGRPRMPARKARFSIRLAPVRGRVGSDGGSRGGGGGGRCLVAAWRILRFLCRRGCVGFGDNAAGGGFVPVR